MIIHFIPFVEGKPREENGNKYFISQVDYTKVEIFGRILDIAKNNSLWGQFWGDKVFTVKMVPTFKKDEDPELSANRPIYRKMESNSSLIDACGNFVILLDFLSFDTVQNR